MSLPLVYDDGSRFLGINLDGINFSVDDNGIVFRHRFYLALSRRFVTLHYLESNDGGVIHSSNRITKECLFNYGIEVHVWECL